MESEVRIVSLHIPILPATSTGATESGKTRARFSIGKTSRKQKYRINTTLLRYQQNRSIGGLKPCKEGTAKYIAKLVDKCACNGGKSVVTIKEST
jgi:hypothetical protein